MTLLRAWAWRSCPRPSSPASGNTSWRKWSMASSARILHGRDCRHDRAHGEKSQGIRPRHHSGDYATLQAPCPNCGGVVKENYRRYTCTGKSGDAEGCGFSFGKTPAGRTFEVAEVEQFLRDRKIGPLEGFRSKAGWPFTAEMVIKFDEETKNYKLEFDFGDDKKGEETGELIDFSAQQSLGACPKCGAAVFEHGKSYVCEKSVPTLAQATPSCDFKSGQIILQQPVTREQMSSCWRPARPTCSTNLSPCAPAAPSRPSWPGTRRPARSTSSSPPRSSRRARPQPKPS